MDVQEVIKKLKKLPKYPYEDCQNWMKKFGVESSTALGVPLPELRMFAKEIGKNHSLALKLWKQNIHEAKLVASLIADPKQLTEKQMDQWTNDFYSWDICDQICMNLFDRTNFYQKKIFQYVKSEKEFVRRTGFVLMATSAVHDKHAANSQFQKYLPLIKEYSTDERNFVKKAVNWALRQIGKRNITLHQPTLKLANELKKSKDKTARWIGSDAARELSNSKTIGRIRKKSS